MKKTYLIVLWTFLTSICYGLEQSVVLEFFDNYKNLAEEFSPKVIELYSDEATISTLRHYPYGQSKKMTMTGKQFKAVLEKALPIAKSRGDINTFSNIEIETKETEARISAHRYSVLKNYTDKGYYMVVKETDGGGLIIIEEHTETQPQTNEWQKSDGSIEKLLKFQENRIKGHLPLMVDEDTRLDAVSIEGKKFIYFYTLVSITKDEIDIATFEEKMRGAVVGQSCSNSELKQILEHGGSLGYIYKDKNGSIISSITVTIEDCKK